MAESLADAAGRHRPGGGGSMPSGTETAAQHHLAGAFNRDDAEARRAARHVARFAPDPAEAAAALGLTLPVGDDPAGPLVQLAARGDTDGVRAWLDSRTLTEVSAIRAALGGRDQ